MNGKIVMAATVIGSVKELSFDRIIRSQYPNGFTMLIAMNSFTTLWAPSSRKVTVWPKCRIELSFPERTYPCGDRPTSWQDIPQIPCGIRSMTVTKLPTILQPLDRARVNNLYNSE